ncbi:hypothetical protein M8J75_010960 [Diaphorina citri]|nr:hypothetical protein M8J75_010960 [Diaphorina citri]
MPLWLLQTPIDACESNVNVLTVKMSVFSSGRKSSLSKKSSLSNSSARSNVPPPARIVNVEKQKAVRFELLKNLDVKSVLKNVYKEQEQKDYDVLIRIIQDSEFVVQDSELLKLLKCAKDSVQFLNEKLKLFVQVLLVFKWCTRGANVVKAYEAFILELCKEQPFYKSLVVEQLVLSFTKVTEPDKINQWKDGFPPACDQIGFKNTHNLLVNLLSNSLIDTDLLMEKCWTFYPHHNIPCAFLSYTHNLLELSVHSCVDPCRKQMFTLIIQKLIHLDTLATRSEIEAAESDHEELLLSSADIFNMEDDPAASLGPAEVMHHPVANLLDLCLMRFFRYIQSVCIDRKYLGRLAPPTSCLDGSSSSNVANSPTVGDSVVPSPLAVKDNVIMWDRTKVLFNELLAVFESTILPTHGITHVPFLVFYFCSLRLSIGENFIEFLWKKIANVKIYNIFRQSCCHYVSSLLIHAHFMPVRVIKTCLNEMSQWCHSYLDNTDLTGEEACSPVKHPVFYSVCQALFSVITYKHSILVDCKKNMKFLQSLNLTRLVMSQLNPLRSCNAEIVSHFASITNTYQIVYCYNVIHQNARLNVLPIVSTDALGNIIKLNTVNALDQYSPFSTFLLVRCKSIITPEIHCQADPIPVTNTNRTQNLLIADPVSSKQADHDEDDFLMSVDSPCANMSLNMSVSA